jgi:serine/threonine protein phosphatase PrpC
VTNSPDEPVGADSPVFGRPSAAAAEATVLPPGGNAALAAYRAEGGDAGWCAVRMASVAGVRHRLAGEPGQDSFAWRLSGQTVALVVADGLGSVPESGGAAARAAAAAAEAAAVSKDGDPGADGVGAAGGRPASGGVVLTTRSQVETALAAAEVAAGGGGATTLLVAVLEADGRGWLARVGDSAAFLVREGGASWCEVFPPPDDERDVAATAALPIRPEAEWGSVELGPSDVLVLATDGVADPWRDGPTTVAPSLAAAFAAHPAPLELARLAGFSRQGCHDDRTIVLLWRLPDAAGR